MLTGTQTTKPNVQTQQTAPLPHAPTGSRGDLFPSEFLTGEMLADDWSGYLTVTGWGREFMFDQKQQKRVEKPVLYLAETQLPMPFNKTNFDSLVKLVGSENADTFIGIRFRFYRTFDKNNHKKCIRVDETVPALNVVTNTAIVPARAASRGARPPQAANGNGHAPAGNGNGNTAKPAAPISVPQTKKLRELYLAENTDSSEESITAGLNKVFIDAFGVIITQATYEQAKTMIGAYLRKEPLPLLETETTTTDQAAQAE